MTCHCPVCKKYVKNLKLTFRFQDIAREFGKLSEDEK